MKILYVSSILKKNSFGEVSKKLINLLEENTDWEINLFNIGCTEKEIDNTMNNFKRINKLKLIPVNNLIFRDKDISSLYYAGLYQINENILDIKPDIVLILYNDNNIFYYSEMINEIRDKWKGKFIAITPIDYTNLIDKLHNINLDGCITMNDWSVKEIEKKNKGKYPVYNVPHIVNTFYEIKDKNKILNIRKELYGNNFNKYIIGCVNANNTRKRLDLVIQSFKLYYKYNSNSLLFIKTTKPDNSLIFFDFNKLCENYPIIVSYEYYDDNKLNEIYNSFDIMINTTDGEGFGLTPFEVALTGKLTILPLNSSFNSLIINNKVPNYLVPCKQYPYQYIRDCNDIEKKLNGNILYSFYYDYKNYKQKINKVTTFNKLINGIKTIVITRKNILNPNYYSNFEDIMKYNWNDLQIQILMTSDIETLRYVLYYLKKYKDNDWPGINRSRFILNYKTLEEYISYEKPSVGIVNPVDIANKIIYYEKNNEMYKIELKELQNYIKNNFSLEKVKKDLISVLRKIKNKN